MRGKFFLILTVAMALNIPAAICLGAEGGPAPAVFFPETSFEFAPVLEDTKVVHDFVIQNKGDAVLKVDRVKTG